VLAAQQPTHGGEPLSISRLLILICSQRKRAEAGLLPAVERYDGPQFRVLRRFLRLRPTEAPRIAVLSARFGLIDGGTLLPFYDQRMTAERARELAPGVLAEFGRLLATAERSQLFLSLSRAYEPALAGYQAKVPATTEVRVSLGGPGRRTAELYEWLYGTRRSPAALEEVHRP
jgi:hypothetical protein